MRVSCPETRVRQLELPSYGYCKLNPGPPQERPVSRSGVGPAATLVFLLAAVRAFFGGFYVDV